MTVETFQSHVPAVAATHVPDAVHTLRAWASTYAEVALFVAPLVDTPFCPDAFRPKVDPRATAEEKRAARDVAVASATAAVLYGAGIGFDPLTALQNVYVVGGRPGLYAAAMVAIVQAAGHEVWTEDITDSRAVVCGRRRGTEQVERVTVTIDGAKRAGWTRNQKYSSEPQAMLWARAASTVCRRIAQDALKGIGASVEELEDTASTSTTAAAGTRTVQRAAAPQRRAIAPAASEPPIGRPVEDRQLPPLPDEGDELVRVEPVTDRTWRALGEVFVALDVKGTGQTERRLDIIERIVGHSVGGRGDVSEADGQLVVDTLRGLDGPGREQLLGRGPAEQPAGDGGPLAVPGDELIGDADPDGDDDYVDDPTADPDFPAVEPQDGGR